MENRKERRFEGVVGLTNIDRPRWPRPRLKCEGGGVYGDQRLDKTDRDRGERLGLVPGCCGRRHHAGDAYQRLARQKPDKVAYLSLEDQGGCRTRRARRCRNAILEEERGLRVRGARGRFSNF